MINNSNNPGFQKEDRIIKAIDGKTINEINNNLTFALKRIFRNQIDESIPFYAKPADPRGKPDIILKHNGETHYVSVKSGAAKEFHREDVFKFTNYLREHSMSQETIDTILLFHFGDGTTDGTGDVRMDYSDIMHKYKDEIKKANEDLNKDRSFYEDFMNRIIFQGNFTQLPAADFIYFGDENFGILCSKNQINKHVKRKNYSWCINLHIGQILMRPYARYVHGDGKHPEKRSLICLEWVGLAGDMSYISERYDD